MKTLRRVVTEDAKSNELFDELMENIVIASLKFSLLFAAVAAFVYLISNYQPS